MMTLKVQNFYAALMETYPDIRTSGEFTKSQLISMKELHDLSIPGPVWQNKGGRGVYKIPDEFRQPTENSTPNVHAWPTPVSPETVQDTVKVVPSMPTPKPHFEPPSVRAFVPERSREFVPFGSYKEVESIVSSGIFYPTYITGLSGNGKSTMVEQICAKHKRPMIRVNLNAMSDEDQLIGSKTLVDGNVEIIEGPVLIAMRTGALLLIDEIDAGSANSLLCLQSILEGKPYYFKMKNELITPAKGFNIVATANTKGKGNDNGQFMGTNILNEAFLERFGVTFEQEYPSAAVELKIIMNLMTKMNCVDEAFASCLSKWADAIRRTYDAGGVDEIMSTRRIIHIVTAFSIFKNKNKAVELCCNRFDAQTKQAFLEMFRAVSPDESSTPASKVEEIDDIEALAKKMFAS